VAPRIDLMTCMRDEAPFVVEFVAHHLVLGFSRVLVASNDCTDGTDSLLDALAAAGAVGHLPHVVAPGEMPQRRGYRHLRAAFAVDRSDWAMALDADEFLCVHAGDRSLGALLSEVPDGVDILALSAATFGPDGRTAWTPEPVTQVFRKAVPPKHRANGLVKSLFRRPSAFQAFQNHAPVGYRGPKPAPVVMTGKGEVWEADPEVPLWKQLRHFRRDRIGHRLAQVNHYATKTWDSFRLRIARGRGAAPFGQPNTRHDLDYFDRIAQAATRPDEAIQAYAAPVAAKMAELRADPRVASAEAEALARYAARIAALDR
jgi:hypothetical protein